MRFYELSIDNKPIAKLGGTSSSAIRISFDFRVYHGADMPNAVVTLTNPPLEFFKNSSKIIGKQCQIKAGITQGVGFKLPSGNSIIGGGYIQNVINDWGKNECSFILSVAPIMTKKQREKGYLIKGESGDAVSLAEQALKNLYGSSVKVTKDAVSVQIPDKLNVGVFHWVDVSNFLLKLSKDKVRVYSSSQGFHISEIKTPNKTPINVKTTDLLEQPNYIEPNKISVTFNLRGDLTIDRKLIFGANIFNTVSPNTNFYANEAKSYISGEWDIISVRHRGDSGSASYKDWATIIEAIQKSKVKA